jgi:Carboxypeptidase regulatory-like domain
MKQWTRASLGLALLASALTAVAQNTNSGDIRGVVTDSSGAIVPGASVKVDDVDKGITHTYTTDSAGLYDTGSIVPDHYLITVTAPGFQSYVRGPITLQVETVTVNAPLSVGSTTQQVVVKTDLPLLTTETGAQSATLESQQLLQLPQVGADWQNFITLLPGASSTIYNNRGGQTASINGNLPYNTVLADGATTTLPMSQNSDVMVLETVSEVKVDDSAFSAQYGIGGATFNQISKGGTNRFHGAAYEYFQNNALNAADYAFGAKNSVSVLRYNNFGFSVGGPILKDKLFFYFNYDKTINPSGGSQGFELVPTQAQLNGDFTGLPTIYDPTTQTVDSKGLVHRTSFADEYHNGNKIPQNMVDPVAAAISKYYPAPNTSSSAGNFFYNVPSSNPFTKYFGRLDYQINQNNHIIVSETESDNPAQFHNQGICPVNCQSGDVSRDNAQVSWVWTISPRTINEARMGFTDQLNFFSPYSLNQGFPTKLGWKFAKADTFPDIKISGNGDIYELAPQSNAVYKEFVFDPSDVVTLIRGRHVLHFGGEFLINRADSTAWGNLNAGTMNYTGVYTQSTNGDTTSGAGFADFLLGYTAQWGANVTPEWGGRLKSPQLFVQDDIKLRPNLTLNVGLRWQGMTGWHEVKGNLISFDPEVTNPANGSPGAVWYGFSKAHGRDSLQSPNYSTFLPRAGFAYQHGPKTVLRGGIGLFGYTWSDDTYGPGLGGAFGSSGGITDNTNGNSPVVLLSSDGNTNYQGPGGLSVNKAYLTAPTTPDAHNGQSISYQEYHTPVPKILQWNFEVQQEVGTNMVVTAAYVASHGYNLLFPVDINQVPEAQLGPNDAGSRPYPLFQSIGSGNTGSGGTNNGVSNYHSLQTTISQRLSHGLQFNANYVWSHMLDSIDSSGWGSSAGNTYYQRSYDVGANYGASNFDIRNSFKASAIYDLPVGQGRQFLNNNRLVDAAVGGWQVSPTIIWSSGIPYTITMSGDNSFSQSTSSSKQYPLQVGNPNPAHKSINEWFDPAAFTQPTAGTFGNTQRNNLYGPTFLQVNAAVGKTFHIWESVNFEIRASANNVINHPSFDAPGNQGSSGNVINGGTDGVINKVTVGGRTMQIYGRISF